MSRNRGKEIKRRAQGRSALSRRGRRLPKIAAALVAALAALAALVAFSPLNGLVTSDSPDTPKAAILDQLDLTFPNPEFVDEATAMLERSGYEVDYYQGREVTVDLYRDLPKQGYDYVILRVHSGLVEEIDPTSGTETLTDYVSLFTGEAYSDAKYAEEVQAGPLGIASSYEGGPEYFGIGPTFIESLMNGKFDDTTIILMGCDGLRAERTARAFLDRGAQTFISWDKPVSATHTDAATERLLRHLFVEGLAAPDAVEKTMDEVGPDPTFDSELLFYP